MRNERHFLNGELVRLRIQLTKIEINYEARMTVLKNYDEQKKIIKLKKDFTLKSESILEELKLIIQRINEIDKKMMMDEYRRENDSQFRKL